MLVHQFLETNAELHSHREALVHLDDRVTYIELERGANRLANFLIDSGLKPGDRIAILLDSSINYVISYFAVLKGGGIVVALNTATTSRIIKNILSDCTPSAIIVHKQYAHFLTDIIDDLESVETLVIDGHFERLERKKNLRIESYCEIQLNGDTKRPSINISSDDTASIIYTSGTTGNPKGVTLTHSNLRANTDSIVEYLSLTYEDKVMAILPFFYSYGNSLLLTHIRVGGCLVIDSRFAYPNVVLEIMSREKATGFSGVPSTFAILMHKSKIHDYPWNHLRYLSQAGGPMSPALTLKIMEAIPHVKIFVMYGQTEASARLSYLEPDRLLEKIGSIGKGIPGVTLTVKDDKGNICPVGETGEIIARGDNIMKGYWNQPEETARVLKPDGLHTGDLAKTDEDGYLYIVSRKSDMIKSGAHRISPKEIEEILAEHEDIIESAVIGVPDEIMGENIKAVIILKDKSNATQRDILKHCRINLPVFKIPKIVEFRENLPKTPSGKIKKHVLVSEHIQQKERG
ncbi:MAG: class I adenylate-forming enzyme family protein [candidate division Zixibacteria bacterium]